MSNRAEYLYAEIRKYAKESNTILGDQDKDRAIVATVAHFVEQEFGYLMGKEAWTKYISPRSKNAAGLAR